MAGCISFTVGGCLVIIAGLVAAGRSLGPARQPSLRRMLGLFGIAYWLSYNIWWNSHGIDVATGLPLQICDINGVIAPLALLTLNRWLRATLYFWAFALTTQALIQPALQAGPANPLFWWFWAQHTIILGYAVFDLAVLGFRPQWQDCGRACAAGAAYLAVVVPLDLWLNADYGYLGDLPPEKFRRSSPRSVPGRRAPSSWSRSRLRPLSSPNCRGKYHAGAIARERLFERPEPLQLAAVHDFDETVPNVADGVLAQRVEHTAGVHRREAGEIGDPLLA